MGWKALLSFFAVLIISGLFMFYLFAPFKTTIFETNSGNSNFSLENSLEGMQFYPNMRYSSSSISYKISDCTLQKKNEMERAFEMISEVSVLGFYPVESGEEISVTCEEKTKMEEGLFIAGEGGPTNITQAGDFNVITHGSVLLIRPSDCENPNVALHELLHALGFDHSENENNIMYEITGCDRTIGDDIPNFINEIYSIPSSPDLMFGNVSAVINGRYLDTDMEIRNNGLKKSDPAKIIILADNETVKELDLDSLGIGYGRKIMLTNVWVPKINVNELQFLIDYYPSELEKNNNRIILKIK